MTAHERVFIGLGTNLGDLRANLEQALRSLDELPETRVMRVSTFVNTAPWGVTDQPRFLNAVAELRTDLEPLPLLEALKRLETALGRLPSERWGPRSIDLDIILYGQRSLQLPQLIIPHPRYREREFVLGPLRELAPEMT